MIVIIKMITSSEDSLLMNYFAQLPCVPGQKCNAQNVPGNVRFIVCVQAYVPFNCTMHYVASSLTACLCIEYYFVCILIEEASESYKKQ